MDEDDFIRWVKLLEQKTGVVLPPAKKEFLCTGLKSRMRATGDNSLSEYRKRLLDGPGSAIEWYELVDCLTVHETRFFRHQPSFNLVAREIDRRAASGELAQGFHAWSAGCATGEEAWSLAMLLASKAMALCEDFRYAVSGTDISARAIALARAGEYASSRIGEIFEPCRRFCNGQEEKQFAIDAAIKRRVGFATLNLLDMTSVAPLKNQDLIFCQNVLIYFPRPRRAEIVNQFVQFLRPGGIMILGPSELMNWSHEDMERIPGRRTLAFRRRASGEASA